MVAVIERHGLDAKHYNMLKLIDALPPFTKKQLQVAMRATDDVVTLSTLIGPALEYMKLC